MEAAVKEKQHRDPGTPKPRQWAAPRRPTVATQIWKDVAAKHSPKLVDLSAEARAKQTDRAGTLAKAGFKPLRSFRPDAVPICIGGIPRGPIGSLRRALL